MESQQCRVAMPLQGERLSQHFGHSEKFIFFNIDKGRKIVTSSETLVPPPHKPGVIPVWLLDNRIDALICSGMGAKAQQILERKNIEVIRTGISDNPEFLMKKYLEGLLVTENVECGHNHGHGHHHGGCGNH